VGAAMAVEFLAELVREEREAGALDETKLSLITRRQRLTNVFHALHERGSALLKQLWEGLSNIDGVRLFGPPPSAPRTPTVSLIVRGIPAREVCIGLAHRGIFASYGNFYAQTVAERLGQSSDGLVRLGCACYTTEEEVERAIESVRAIAKRQR
jgi:selenocysteine lyase/cysteine desulfurase